MCVCVGYLAVGHATAAAAVSDCRALRRDLDRDFNGARVKCVSYCIAGCAKKTKEGGCTLWHVFRAGRGATRGRKKSIYYLIAVPLIAALWARKWPQNATSCRPCWRRVQNGQRFVLAFLSGGHCQKCMAACGCSLRVMSAIALGGKKLKLD